VLFIVGWTPRGHLRLGYGSSLVSGQTHLCIWRGVVPSSSNIWQQCLRRGSKAIVIIAHNIRSGGRHCHQVLTFAVAIQCTINRFADTAAPGLWGGPSPLPLLLRLRRELKAPGVGLGYAPTATTPVQRVLAQ
jgi:hypothetical protein